jgi:hypothetical protein
MIENVLEKQVKEGANQYNDEAGVEIPKEAFTIEELDASVITVDKILKARGFKPLETDSFNQRVRNIFGRIIDVNSGTKYLYVNFHDKCDKKMCLNPNNRVDYKGIYIVKDKKIISDFYYLPQLIDYRKEYPQIAKIEETIITNYKDSDGNKIDIEKWVDLEKNEDNAYNLTQNRNKSIQTIVSRNKYLFNDSKADLAWLLQNDKDFLEDLLVVFGYDKEDKINEMVLNDRIKGYSEQIPIATYKIGDLFFTKDCNGKLIIRKGLLDYVRRKTTAIDNRYIYALSTYMDILYTGDEDKAFDYDPTTRFTETEKAEIVAHVASIESPAFWKYKKEEGSTEWSNAVTGLYFLSVTHSEVISVIKQNNYFNIHNMKQVIEDLQEEAPPTPDGGDEE